MHTYLDCYPCFLRQALEAARHLGADEPRQKVLLDRVLELLKGVDLSSTPPEIGERVHYLVRRELGDSDPYREYKEKATREASAIYPRLRSLLDESEDPLQTAVRLSIAGNIIDAGVNHTYQLWSTVQRVLDQPFGIDDMEALREALARVSAVLYLADNAGETVFDRLLIETLDKPVTYAVKGGPILNDATVEDAELIIAKGQGNYETLSEQDSKVFFLLQAKCPVIARDLGVPVGGIVVRQGGRTR